MSLSVSLMSSNSFVVTYSGISIASSTCRSRTPNKMVVTQVQNAASTRTVVINIEEPMPLCLIYDLYFLSRILSEST